jgi:hypothetical protein
VRLGCVLDVFVPSIEAHRQRTHTPLSKKAPVL